MSNTRQPAYTLPCLFKDIVDKYPESQLRPCKTDSLTWKHASSSAAAERINEIAKYFPELFLLNLENFSLCVNHYNQIVATKNFVQNLLISDSSEDLDVHSIKESKKVRRDEILETSSISVDTNNDDENGIVNHEPNLLRELQSTKHLLAICRFDCQQKSQHILQLQQQLEAKNCEIETLKQMLIDSYSQLNQAQNKNNVLIKHWDSRFDNQQKRIDAVVEIASAERESVYNDVEILIRNDDRFSLNNLMNYSPEIWLSQRNQTLVKFIEALTHNNYDSSQEKLFKRAVAIDAIYGARHGRYVSEISLAASAIKYSLARSKKIINIDNHITRGGSYTYFQKWLENLTDEEEPLPEGLLFMAFDNEQRGQKNYLDRGFNTVIYHIVTSFVAFNMGSEIKIQHTQKPWLYKTLTEVQYKELFNPSPQMQQEFDNEIYHYLNEIINQLKAEKTQLSNKIDDLIEKTTNSGFDKYCSSCNEKNIENRKQICPKCHAHLSTLIELRKGIAVEKECSPSDQSQKLPSFRSHYIDTQPTTTSTPQISLTQHPVPDRNVHIPEIYVPDPLNINPNSITNVEKVLCHIEEKSGIKDGSREWMAVVCDGVPYHHATKLREKFPWLVITPGQLHEEMNMLRAYVELNW